MRSSTHYVGVRNFRKRSARWRVVSKQLPISGALFSNNFGKRTIASTCWRRVLAHSDSPARSHAVSARRSMRECTPLVCAEVHSAQPLE
eukprot:11907515-Alexandrium_andersonii.AAC.1